MSISSAELRRRAETAIAEGGALLEWIPTFERDVRFVPLHADAGRGFSHAAEGFFGEVPIGGVARTAMGCRQRLSIAPGGGPATVEQLRDFAFRQLLGNARTALANGRLSGFTTARIPLDEAAEGAAATAVPDWRALSETGSLAVISLELHDFELRIGPIALRPRQIVYVVQHPAFVSEQEQPEPGVLHSVTLGYPFVPYAPLRNPFGFGPGKFGAALKLFTFSLRVGGGLDVEMLFVAAPRCGKVLDVLGLPDPVFGGLRLMEVATLGAFRAQPRRDRIEAMMLETHCRVHGALIAGFARRWAASSAG